ncbi:DUF4421 domain-containing protein [Algoriphagus litoralis]|uniref:DUF4421 domain-containing protein n=1 Tax=Algoriphagus litoralis TaxID=2202829 RepID=UPI000DBA63D0|nr:DUF4421 domain-containing protein [Algoriphagus litoralis]
MKRFLFLPLFFIFFGNAMTQTKGIDTAYIKESPQTMALRMYVSRKYTELNYGDQVGRYEPNSGLNFGFGVSFQKFTLNLAVPLSFLNPNREKDWPGFLDLQSHIYPNKWIIDAFGQFYLGYYIRDFQNTGEDYFRRDVRVVKLGASVNYLFNGDKLSFEAAFHQTAIQKKSAFSPMVGFEAYRVRISGDSLIIPNELMIPGNYSRADFYQVGPSAGLAGTLVFGKGFFLTGAASGNLGLGFSKAEQDKDTRRVELMTGYFLRGFAGYNGERFSINGSYLHKQLNLAKQIDIAQSANTGNYRINFIYKINPGPKFTKTYTKLNPKNILMRIFD